MEHLLNNCPLSENIWNQATQLMRRTKRVKNNIISTIRDWGSGSFKSPILNRTWQLLPGFIVWQLWKERNRRIFHSQPSPPTLLWNTILLHLQETLQLQLWTKEDFPTDPGELSLLNSWGFSFSHSTPPQQPPLNSKSLSPSKWLPPPPPGFHKVNFDGASKGNPGHSGYGAVIRNNLGQIQSLIAENLGCDTNNSTEIWGLIKGVQMALDQNLTCLIIEGDSKIIIDLATKILNGRDPGKITPSWRLLGPLYSFQALLRPSLTLTPSHIRRSENKVADRLANAGVDSMQQIILHDSRQSQSSPLWLQCKELAQLDLWKLHSQGGIHSIGEIP
jgi:ribonuclease HI